MSRLEDISPGLFQPSAAATSSSSRTKIMRRVEAPMSNMRLSGVLLAQVHQLHTCTLIKMTLPGWAVKLIFHSPSRSLCWQPSSRKMGGESTDLHRVARGACRKEAGRSAGCVFVNSPGGSGMRAILASREACMSRGAIHSLPMVKTRLAHQGIKKCYQRSSKVHARVIWNLIARQAASATRLLDIPETAHQERCIHPRRAGMGPAEKTRHVAT